MDIPKWEDARDAVKKHAPTPLDVLIYHNTPAGNREDEFYAQVKSALEYAIAETEADAERWKQDYLSAAELVATMHARLAELENLFHCANAAKRQAKRERDATLLEFKQASENYGRLFAKKLNELDAVNAAKEQAEADARALALAYSRFKQMPSPRTASQLNIAYQEHGAKYLEPTP